MDLNKYLRPHSHSKHLHSGLIQAQLGFFLKGRTGVFLKSDQRPKEMPESPTEPEQPPGRCLPAPDWEGENSEGATTQTSEEGEGGEGGPGPQDRTLGLGDCVRSQPANH